MADPGTIGIHQLSKFQIGKETDRGTAVAATKIVAGKCEVNIEDEWYNPQDTLGVLSKNQRAEVILNQTAIKYSGPAYFEQMLWWLSSCVIGGIAATNPAANIDLWTYTPNLTASNVPTTYTIEFGNNAKAWRVAYAFARSLTLKIAPKEPVMVDVDLVARGIAENAFTGSLTMVTGLEAPISTKAQIYSDANWAALGTTVMNSLLVNGEITVPGFAPLHMADGVSTFSRFGDQGRAVTGKLTLLYDATNADAEFDAYRAGTRRYIRIKVLGSVINTTYYKTLQLDMALKWTKFNVLREWEGQSVVEAEFVTEYDTTGTKEFEISVQNALTTVP